MLQQSQRKTLKQRKPEKDMPDPREPPPTQMQALEVRVMFLLFLYNFIVLALEF